MFVSVCVHVFVLICDLHVHVSLSSCGVSYFWQGIVGGKVCVCVYVYLFLMRPLLNVPSSHSGRQGAMWST